MTRENQWKVLGAFYNLAMLFLTFQIKFPVENSPSWYIYLRLWNISKTISPAGEAGRAEAVDHAADHRAPQDGGRRGGRVHLQPARGEGEIRQRFSPQTRGQIM